MKIIGCPSQSLWGRFQMSYYWKNCKGEHPKIGEVITLKDIEDKKWIPYNDGMFEACKDYLFYQNDLPEDKKQIGIPPFKIVFPLNPNNKEEWSN